MTNTTIGCSLSGEFTTVDGSRIYYETAGKGSGVVLLHAGIADSRMWDQQFSVFSEHFTVLRYDFAGFGRSTHPADRYAHYEHLARLLENLGMKTVSLVGVSMGGTVALEFAAAYPAAVNRIVLSGAGVGFTPVSEERYSRNLEINEAFESGEVSDANELEVRMWVDGPLRSPEDVDTDVRSLVTAMNLALLESMPADDQEYGIEPPVTERLSEIAQPVLLITGELDMPDVHDAAKLLEASIPNVTGVTIPKAAHMVNMEHPEQFNQIVLKFL